MSDFVKKIVVSYPKLKYELLKAQTFDMAHYGFPPIYYTMMETDEQRVNSYKRTFAHYNHLKDAVVCEAGVGTLALTQHYLPYVKKAYLIENNPNVIDFIKAELKRNGWEDKVVLIHGDAMKTDLPEQVDFLIGELMSIYCANEYQVQIFKHLRQFLKPDGKLIPEKIINVAQVGEAEFEEEYTHYPIMFTRHLPMFLSTLGIVNTIDLYKEEALTINSKTQMTALLSGKANAVYMSSWVQMAEGINFTGTDSLMPPTVKLLDQTYDLKAGQSFELNSSFGYGTNLDLAKFSVR